MPLNALILDVDGTLVDTNSLHVQTFARAFERFGYTLAPARIEPEIGKGGDHLVGDVLGESVEREHGEAIRDALKPIALETFASHKVAVLPGATQIIRAAHARGWKVAIATSGDKAVFEVIETSCGIKFSDLVDLLVTADDAEQSKPAPDVLNAALQKLGLAPGQCALVGDTVHDAHAAQAAQMPFFGVLTGFHSAAALRQAGARQTFRDCAEIAEKLAEFDQWSAK